MPESEDSSKENNFICGNGFKGKTSSEKDSGCHASSVTRSSSSSSDEDSLPAPPDGQWGWVVVLASFIAHLIADGCCFSFGVLLEELLDYFQESTAKTAWVGSLFVSIPLLSGPIASALTIKYGCRRVTMMGGFIAGAGMIASSFVNSIEMLCLTYGVIAGCGLSMVYVPAVVIVAFYFEKRRAFATGIAVAGSGIGTFIFAPLTEKLIQEYSWNGALLIIGGLVFNIIACGACFRPLESQKMMKQKEKMRKSVKKFSRMSSRVEIEEVILNGIPGQEKGIRADPYEQMTHSLVQFPTFLKRNLNNASLEEKFERGCDARMHRQLVHNLPANRTFIDCNEVTQGSDVSSSVDTVVIGKDSLFDSTHVEPKDNKQNVEPVDSGTTELLGKKKSKKDQDSDRFQPLHRKDIFYRGSLMRTGIFLKNDRAASCPDIFVHSELQSDNSLTGKCTLLRLSKEVNHVFRQMLDLSICRSVVFVYFCIHSMLLYLAYDNPYVYFPEYATSLGISTTKSSYLLSIIGISSTFGQIFMGFIGDQQKVDTLHFYNAMTIIAGVIVLFVPLLTHYMALCAFCASYGFFISANYALTTIILVDLLGMEKLTNAYGLVNLAEGISQLVGPPIAGWFYDVTGSFDLTFYFSGAVILASGAMLFAVPCLRRCDHFYQQQEDEQRSQEKVLDSIDIDKTEETTESEESNQLVESSSVPDISSLVVCPV